jgi:ferric-dicitrate binding protein FerR (iron transport regulator)
MTDMNSLINRFFLRETTPRENEDLAAWIEADAAHKAEFERAYDVFVLSQMLLGGNTISQVRKPRRHFSALFVKRAAAAVAVAAALVAGVVLGKEYYTRPLLKTIQGTSLVSETQPGLRTTVFLSDGTRVDLNSGSHLEYPAIFYGPERRVALKGEAMFDVAKDAEHPFIVETFSYDVKAVGTRFDVIADEFSGEFSTALLEGNVVVLDKQAQPAVWMEPKEIVRLVNGKLLHSKMESTEAYLWTDGIVSVTGVPFDELLRMLERAYGVHIEMRRKDIPEIHYSYLKFRVSDGIEHAFRILRRRCDFNYSYEEATGIYYID